MVYNTIDFIFDAFQGRNSDYRPFSVSSYLTGIELHYSNARRKPSLYEPIFSLLTPATESFDGSLSIHKSSIFR